MAGTTTYLGISYPTSTDYVKDGASAMQTIATGFDTAVAIPNYNAQTGTTYTFALSDIGKVVTANNASSQTYTIPPAASVTWPTNATLEIVNLGAGVVTFAGGSGVTVTNSAQTLAQYQSAALVRTASNAWTVIPFVGGGSKYGVATGGTSSSITDGGVNYTLLSFTGSGSLVVSTAGLFDIMLIGGGGGGGRDNGGGGGAGAFIIYQSLQIPAATYTVTVGGGGAGAPGGGGNAANGGLSEITGLSAFLRAIGGGRGGYYESGQNASDGGSGGGAGAGGAIGLGLGSPFGRVGGLNQGGGGGASAVGTAGTGAGPGSGGNGSASTFSGTSVTRSGGGGAGATGGTPSTGGTGGGGAGTTTGTTGVAGTANTGGGGGGGGRTSPSTFGGGGAGGSGLVLVRFKV